MLIFFFKDGLVETLRRTGQHFIHCFIVQQEAGFTNRTDVAATRVFHSMYKLQAITLSPNSIKSNPEPVDVSLLRQQVNYTIWFQFIISLTRCNKYIFLFNS